MKTLLLDQNLSPRLINRVIDLYPNVLHTDSVGLRNAPDRDVWEYARRYDYIVVSKDADFSELLLLFGTPPKIVWIRRGNCSTSEIAQLLRDHFEMIETFCDDPESGILALY